MNGAGILESNLRSIRSSVLLQPSLSLWVGPFLELEVLGSVSNWPLEPQHISYSSVNGVSPSTTLNHDKDNCSNNWDKVQWQVHDISDQCRWWELLKRWLHQFPKLRNGIVEISSLQLSALRNDSSLILRYQGSIKCINKCVLNEEGAREEIDNRRTFAECEEDCGKCRKRSVDEYQNS